MSLNGQIRKIDHRLPHRPMRVTRDRKPFHRDTPTPISAARITQATTARFVDLSFTNALLVFVERGEKRVLQSGVAEQHAKAGEVLVFPPGAIATIENRTWSQHDYVATVVSYPNAVIALVFGEGSEGPRGLVQRVRTPASSSSRCLQTVQHVLRDSSLPVEVAQHRLVEPLLWLKGAGVEIPTAPERDVRQRLRALIDEDLSHPWRAADAAQQLAVSEATLRRLLSRSGDSFSKLLRDTRLERSLSLLQTTDQPITEIALACGFATPSHFSQCFKERFRIQPRAIRTRAD